MIVRALAPCGLPSTRPAPSAGPREDAYAGSTPTAGPTGPTAPEVELRAFLANPLDLTQGRHPHTCVVTTLTYKLAREAPEELARLARGLLYEGEVRLAGGGKLSLDPDSLAPDDTGRGLVQRVLQTALHQHAGGTPTNGLSPMQANALYRQVLGQDDLQRLPMSPELMASLENSLAEGEGVLATFRTARDSGHEVLLEKLDADWAYYRDPEGEDATPFPGEGSDVDSTGRGRVPRDSLTELAAVVHLPLLRLPYEMRPPGSWTLG